MGVSVDECDSVETLMALTLAMIEIELSKKGEVLSDFPKISCGNVGGFVSFVRSVLSRYDIPDDVREVIEYFLEIMLDSDKA